MKQKHRQNNNSNGSSFKVTDYMKSLTAKQIIKDPKLGLGCACLCIQEGCMCVCVCVCVSIRVFSTDTLEICSKLLHKCIFRSWCAPLAVEARANLPGETPSSESTHDQEGWGVKQKMIHIINKIRSSPISHLHPHRCGQWAAQNSPQGKTTKDLIFGRK